MKRWACGHQNENGDVHVWPVDQTDIHRLEDRACFCGPKIIEEYGMDGVVVVHRDAQA